jgi:hypothetical protein
MMLELIYILKQMSINADVLILKVGLTFTNFERETVSWSLPLL